MVKTFVLCLSFLSFSVCGYSQLNRYIVRLADKAYNPFSLDGPSAFLTQRSIDRRVRYNIQIDSTDLPVTPRYIDSIRLAGDVDILNVSKWLNQVAIQTTDAAALLKINAFPFVIATQPVGSRGSYSAVNKQLDAPTTSNTTPSNIHQRLNGYYNYGQSAGQVQIHNGDFLHNHGFRGEGMQMAVLDAGFFHYMSLPTFDSMRLNNHVLGTWDFVAREESVDEDNYHGMQCLSTIAANLPGSFVGTAPNTSFYLYRTEDVNSEYPIEEQNWVAGMERADSLGVDITSTSLGYSRFDQSQLNYTYADMDGNTTISARGADLAAKKGMLLVTAAGNEGNNSWHYLITPSDADSSLSVGAVSVTGAVAGFSSYGPSSDGQVKPSVAAVGLAAVVANIYDGQPSFSNGTSFACPNMAGISTCLWQAFPEVNNMQIIDALQQSASTANQTYDRVGFGIPDVKKAFVRLQKLGYKKQLLANDCRVQVAATLKMDNTMRLSLERKSPLETAFNNVITTNNPGDYGFQQMELEDNISNIATGVINYRLRVDIAADTSYYIDSFTVSHDLNCNGITPVDNIVVIQQQELAQEVAVRVNRITPAMIQINIHNSLGQKLYAESYNQAAGTLTKKLDLSRILPGKGVYVLSVFVDNKKAVTRQIIRP